jgi:hypothetical protein
MPYTAFSTAPSRNAIQADVGIMNLVVVACVVSQLGRAVETLLARLIERRGSRRVGASCTLAALQRHRMPKVAQMHVPILNEDVPRVHVPGERVAEKCFKVKLYMNNTEFGKASYISYLRNLTSYDIIDTTCAIRQQH